MKPTIRRLVKKPIKIGARMAKATLNKSPRLKQKLKAVVLAHVQVPQSGSEHEAYQKWLLTNIPDGIDVYEQSQEAKKLQYKPLVSIIVPTYNTPEKFFHETVRSVLAQTYQNWELVFVDDASPDENVRKMIKQYAANDERVVYKFLKKNKHISGATNEGIKIAKGEFIALFDHDDLLWPNALFEVAKALNEDGKLNFIYSDEDKIEGNNRHSHFDPFFKPDWSPDFLRSVNYITHLATIRKSVLDEFGYEDGKYNGAQDWELFLRVTRNILPDSIHHIPKVLYSWRVHDQSTAMSLDSKPYVLEAQRKALIDDAKGRKLKASVKRDNLTGYWSMNYGVSGNPIVSIVIPTKNLYKVVKRCIDSIYEKTTYRNFEIILVDTGSDDKRIFEWYDKLKNTHDNINIVDFIEKKFSYARSCNYGASLANGDYLIMLNNDIEVISPNWIEGMLGYAQRPEIGVVGAKLYYPDGESIQHAGVGLGMGGRAANQFTLTKESDHLSLVQSLMLKATRNVSAVTAACAMMKKSDFDKIGGFNEKYRINYNDVDLCLRFLKEGRRNVYLPTVELIHHESVSRGLPETKNHDGAEFTEAQQIFDEEWTDYIERDPMINPNISLDTPSFNIRTN